MTRLAGKKAIVTGGSRGIGAAIARRLAAEGAAVALTYARSPDAAHSVVADITGAGGVAHAIHVDASDPARAGAGLVEAADRLGGLDILVHNAGVGAFVPVSSPEAMDAYRRMFAVNVDAVFAGTAALVDRIADGGRIIVISSINAHTMPIAGGSIYGATKAAVSAMVRGWARDLGPRQILVNAIQPGPIDTDMNPAAGEWGERLARMTAIGRYGTGDEVAALAAFLASDEASYITGASIDIDGGLTI